VRNTLYTYLQYSYEYEAGGNEPIMEFKLRELTSNRLTGGEPAKNKYKHKFTEVQDLWKKPLAYSVQYNVLIRIYSFGPDGEDDFGDSSYKQDSEPSSFNPDVDGNDVADDVNSWDMF